MLIFNPFTAAYNNIDCIAYPAATVTTYGKLNVMCTVGVKNIRSPFTASSLAGPQSRLVGAGFRMRYIGKYLDTSGSYVSRIREARILDLGEATLNEIFNDPLSRKAAVRHGQWFSCGWRPSDSTDADYSKETATAISKPLVVLGVRGCQFSAPFEWEAVFYHEYLPQVESASVPGTTKSHTDLPGLSAVRDFINTAWNSDIGQSLYTKGINYVKKTLYDNAFRVGQTLLTMG